MFAHLYKSSPAGDGLLYAWFMAMHTRMDIALYARLPEDRLLAVVREIRQEVFRLESVGNFYDEHSELSLLNRSAHQGPIALSEELYRMVGLCREYHAATYGCFDVTVRSDGYDGHTLSCIELSDNDGSISFSRPGIRIDLSGFLKGYALEKVRPVLQRWNISHALISFGNSSVLALGNHPVGSGWKLGENIVLADQCLTVSGNDTDNRRHIISPALGRMVSGKRQIAVVTEDAAWGEALSTALFAATPEQYSLLQQHLGSSDRIISNYTNDN